MSFWQILNRLVVSNEGQTIQRVSDTTYVSSDGTTYTRMGATTVGSDGSTFTQIGNFSTDGSTQMGNTATGLGSVFNQQDDWSKSSSNHKFSLDDDHDSW
jgi:hypothetical protein